MTRKHMMRMTTLMIIFTIVLTGCLSTPPQKDTGDEQRTDMLHNGQHNESAEPATPIDPPKSVEPEPYYVEATLIAVGDVMAHMPQITGAYDKETNTYSFAHYFTEIAPYLEGDWVIANLETPLAGADLGFSGYPQFNAPVELADALKEAGFNIVTTANNHAMDRREKGVLRTLEALQQRDLLAVGTYASQEEADDILVVTKNGISMAILAYTYGVNGIPIPEGKSYLVNLIDEEKIAADIQKARDLGVDVVTVALHMEGEYHRLPNDGQKKLTQFVIEAGADIILGSHPHVVQPYDIVEVIDENGLPRQAIIIYSLGNFISNQGPPRTAKYTDVGVIFNINITKHYPEEKIQFSVVEATATWVHRYTEGGKFRYRILPIEATLAAKDDPDAQDPLLQAEHYNLLQAYKQEMEQHIAAFLTE